MVPHFPVPRLLSTLVTVENAHDLATMRLSTDTLHTNI